MVERIIVLESSSDTKPSMAGNEGERFLLVFGQLPIKAIIQIIHWSPNPLQNHQCCSTSIHISVNFLLIICLVNTIMSI